MAASTEKARPYLNGVYFDNITTANKPNVLLVATNGHMLIKIEGEGHIHHNVKTFEPFILPSDTITKIIKLANMAQKAHKKSSVVLEFNTKTNTCAIGYGINDLIQTVDSVSYTPIDGKFPDYNRVIPTPSKSTISEVGLNASYVDIMGKAVKTLTGNKFANIQLHFGNDNKSPMRVTASGAFGFLGVLMPVRI